MYCNYHRRHFDETCPECEADDLGLEYIDPFRKGPRPGIETIVIVVVLVLVLALAFTP